MKKIQGIYQIINNKNGKFYVGSSSNVKQRINKHFYLLKNNLHENSYLQNSFNKHGLENFSWTLLNVVESENLRLNKENELLKKYHDNQTLCYNINKTAYKTGRVKTLHGLEALRENGRKNCLNHWKNKEFVHHWRSVTQTPEAIKKRCEAAKKANSKRTTLSLYDGNNGLLVVEGNRTEIARVIGLSTGEVSRLISKQCRRVKEYSLTPKKSWHIKNGERKHVLFDHTIRSFILDEKIGSYSHFKNMLIGKRTSYCGWSLIK